MDRRKFISTTVVAAAAFPALSSFSKEKKMKEDIKTKPEMTIGVISLITNPEEDIKKVKEFGFDYFQAYLQEYSPEMANRIVKACEKYKVTPLTLICMGPGPYIWNFMEGPSTIGLIPEKFRAERIQHLKDGIDFCNISGFCGVHAHFGFIPEDPKVLFISNLSLL